MVWRGEGFTFLEFIDVVQWLPVIYIREPFVERFFQMLIICLKARATIMGIGLVRVVLATAKVEIGLRPQPQLQGGKGRGSVLGNNCEGVRSLLRSPL